MEVVVIAMGRRWRECRIWGSGVLAEAWVVLGRHRIRVGMVLLSRLLRLRVQQAQEGRRQTVMWIWMACLEVGWVTICGILRVVSCLCCDMVVYRNLDMGASAFMAWRGVRGLGRHEMRRACRCMRM